MEGFEIGGGKLKHLGFMKILLKTSMLVLLCLYQYVKEKYFVVGSTVISNSENVIIAVYTNTKFIPLHLLSFLDQKVDVNAPVFVKKVLDRTDQIVDMALDIGQMLVMQVKLVGLQNAMAIIVTFIKNHLFGSLLPLWVSKLFQFPVLGSMTKMAFSPLSSFSDKYRGYPILSKLVGVPIPDLTKALDQDGMNFSEDLTKAFKEVGVAPAENFIGDFTKTFKKVEKNDIIKDTANANALKKVALAAPREIDEGRNIIQGFSNALLGGRSSSKTN